MPSADHRSPEPRPGALDELEGALAELRHDRFGFYGSLLRDQLLAGLSVPLTAAEYRVLRSVESAGPAALAVQQIADLMLTDPGRASRAVDRLVRRGLVERRPDPSDRRRRFVVLTTSGQQVLQEAAETRADHLRQLCLDWSVDDVRRLALLLRRFSAGVRRQPLRTPSGRTLRG
jgi:DNA-binding MarR family transcriptional regulator